MIFYLATMSKFRNDTDSNRIEEKVHAEFARKPGKLVGEAELKSCGTPCLS